MTTKTKTIFRCNHCGYTSPKWLGKCPACMQWNCFSEEIEFNEKKSYSGSSSKPLTPVELDSIGCAPIERIVTKDAEFNRAIGGGIVPGGVYLLSGDPGIGKSTLLLQLAVDSAIARTLYVSAEESKEQIRLRAERLQGHRSESQCFVLDDGSLQNILRQAKKLQPSLLIIDSIQTIYSQEVDSIPGSVIQVRECAFQIIQFAKSKGIPTIIVGHITKEGVVAGPKLLEHMVDALLHFEGDRTYTYRLLRAIKNRFGPSAALGVYTMEANGLVQVKNPSFALLHASQAGVAGTAISCIMQGLQPMLIETQALVAKSIYNIAQRSATGFNQKKLDMLLAVMEKKCNLRLSLQDVFLNIAGGFKVEDRAADLAAAVALASSYKDISVGAKICFIAEVGLIGELRPVSKLGERIQEVEKLGFEMVVVPPTTLNARSFKIEVRQLGTLHEVFKTLF